MKISSTTFAFSGKFRILQHDDNVRTALFEADGMDAKGRGGVWIEKHWS